MAAVFVALLMVSDATLSPASTNRKHRQNSSKCLSSATCWCNTYQWKAPTHPAHAKSRGYYTKFAREK
ncbi:hypothetical protein PI126_g12740 [Phytophthora idaei]|nr:hypothetical protein PI126_g12740 [Phytophthora idaei]